MKRLIATIIALAVFLGVAFNVEKKQEESKNKMPTVAILQTLSHPALDQIHQGIVDGLKEEGFVNGKTMKIDYQNAQGDQSNLKTMSDRFVQEKASVLIGIATPAVQSLANENSKIPITMGAVSDPVGTGLVKTLEKPGGTVSGVMHKEPVAAQMKLIREFMPDLKNIGVIYTSSDDSSIAEYKEFKKLAEKAGITVKTYTITSTNDIDQVSATMASEVQAVYVPSDNTVASGFSTLVKNTNAKNIPIFPGVDSMIKGGGVATVSVSQYELGKLTGKMAAQELRGKNPATMPVETVKKGSTVINQKQADKLGLKVPASAIKQANEKGEIIK